MIKSKLHRKLMLKELADIHSEYEAVVDIMEKTNATPKLLKREKELNYLGGIYMWFLGMHPEEDVLDVPKKYYKPFVQKHLDRYGLKMPKIVACKDRGRRW